MTPLLLLYRIDLAGSSYSMTLLQLLYRIDLAGSSYSMTLRSSFYLTPNWSTLAQVHIDSSPSSHSWTCSQPAPYWQVGRFKLLLFVKMFPNVVFDLKSSGKNAVSNEIIFEVNIIFDAQMELLHFWALNKIRMKYNLGMKMWNFLIIRHKNPVLRIRIRTSGTGSGS
jgi:hypothetical protein